MRLSPTAPAARRLPTAPGRALAAALLAAAAAVLCARPARADAPPARSCVAAHAEAQRLRFSGQLLAARAQLLACGQSECPQLVANDCTLWLAEVDASLSSLVLAVEGQDGRDLVDVKVFANGRLLTQRTDGRALPLDPGRYVFRFEADGYEPLAVEVSIRQSEKNRILRAQLAPVPGARPKLAASSSSAAGAGSASADEGSGIPVATYVLGGVALAAFGTFGYFALSGRQDLDDLEATCGKTRSCSDEEIADGQRAYIVADVALGVGVASAIAATLVYFLVDDDDPAPPEPTAGLTAGVLDGGAFVGWSARY